jgi:hypothetical protein
MHWLSPPYYLEMKFEPLEIIIKKDCHQSRLNFSEQPVLLFYHKRNEEILEELKVEPVEEKLRRCN